MSADYLKRLEDGIRAADANGDTEGVQKLGAAYRQLQQQMAGASAPDQPANDGGLDALVYGFDSAGKMIGGGIEGLGQLTGSQWLQDVGKAQVESNEADIARRNYQRPEEADGIVKNLRQGEFGNALSSLGYSVAESAPSVGVGVGAGVGAAVGGTAGLAAAGIGTGVGTLMALGEARDERASQGMDDTANLGDLATAVASGLVELVPVGKGAGAALKFTKEGLQEAAQEGLVVGNSAFQGGEYVAEDVLHRLADAGITGGIVSKGAGVVNAGGQAAVNKVTSGVRTDSRDYSGDEVKAAERLLKAADGDMSVLANVDHTRNGSAKGAAKAAVSQIRAEAGVIVTNLRKLANARKDPDAVAAVNTMARTMAEQTTPTPDAFKNDLDMYFPGEADVARLRSLHNEMNVIQDFTSGGTNDMGGLAKLTRLADVTDERNSLKLMGAGAAATGRAATLAGGFAANRGARLIDKATNRRSKVKRFTESALKSGEAPSDVVGPSALDTLNELKATQAAEKLAKKGSKKALKEDTTNTGEKHAEDLAARFQLHNDATADMFTADKADPEIAYQIPYAKWQTATGAGPDTTLQVLEALAQEGRVGKDVPQRFRENIRSFETKGKNAGEVYALQEMVRQRVNSGHKNAKTDPAELAKQLNATSTRVTSNRATQKAMEADRIVKNITHELEASKADMPADVYTSLVSLKDNMNHPKTIRAERFAMLDASLATLFPQDAQSRDFWLKEFYPLASIGNDKPYLEPKKKKKGKKSKNRDNFKEKQKNSTKHKTTRKRKRRPEQILADLEPAE